MSSGDYFFFLSYARADRRRDPSIERFFRDVSNEVATRTGWDGSVGFLDTTDIEPGQTWPTRLEEALSSARAFVPILSPTYFDRPYCGREWAAFLTRLGRVSPADQPLPLIQPVMLVPDADLMPMPRAVGDTQFKHDTYPQVYRQQALSYLASLDEERDAYIRFYKAFATLLIKAVRENPLERSSVPPLASLASAFHHPGTQLQDIAPEAEVGKRLFVQFIYAAARRQEFEVLGQQLVFHGDEGGYDWQPFMPDLDAEVNMLATELVGKKRYRYEAAPFDAAFVDRVEQAVNEDKIVVVVVDPWTVRLDRYAAWVRRLDSRRFLTCVVVIPWNPNEPMTADCRATLEDAVRATFYSTFQSPDPETFVPWVESASAFEEMLAARLEAMKMRIINRDREVRRAEARGAFVTLPLVAGTQAT